MGSILRQHYQHHHSSQELQDDLLGFLWQGRSWYVEQLARAIENEW